MDFKVYVAIGIFAVMFILAFWANELTENRYFIEDKEDQVRPFMINANDDSMSDRFRPREYIKVVN